MVIDEIIEKKNIEISDTVIFDKYILWKSTKKKKILFMHKIFSLFVDFPPKKVDYSMFFFVEK